jgi:hypothetical protein
VKNVKVRESVKPIKDGEELKRTRQKKINFFLNLNVLNWRLAIGIYL